MDDARPAPAPISGGAANIAEETRAGRGAAVVRRGTAHLSPGAEVYSRAPIWGDGYEKVKVLGRHRGGSRLVEMVVPFRHLDLWRAKLVYRREVIERMTPWWTGSADSQAEAEGLARWGQVARS